MEWQNEDCLKLIEAYKKHPEVWNLKHPKFYSKKCKTRAWLKIAEEMGLEEGDVAWLQWKMRALASSLRREKAKIKATLDKNEVYKSRWFAFEAMSFLLDMKYRKCLAGYKDQSTSQDDQENSNTDTNPTNSTNEETPSSAPKRRKLQNDLEPSTSTQPTDEFSTFGQHVASQLRNLPIVNAIVSQNYINTYLAEERLKVIKACAEKPNTSDGVLNCHDEDVEENSQEEDFPDMVKVEVFEGEV